MKMNVYIWIRVSSPSISESWVILKLASGYLPRSKFKREFHRYSLLVDVICSRFCNSIGNRLDFPNPPFLYIFFPCPMLPSPIPPSLPRLSLDRSCLFCDSRKRNWEKKKEKEKVHWLRCFWVLDCRPVPAASFLKKKGNLRKKPFTLKIKRRYSERGKKTEIDKEKKLNEIK